MLRKLKIFAITSAVVIIAGFALWFWFFSPMGVSIRRSDDIATTKTYVTAMRDIGQWEFLAINDEELVDTVDKGFFSDKELIRIYYGTLRLGIDFSQCDETWINVDGDSITLDLPQVKLLDENFIDEARTQAFFETGSWTNKDRQSLTMKAHRMMKDRCLTKKNLDLAQEAAEQQVMQFLRLIHKQQKQ
ncbi:MAG: DUF4230 domain-containing protein [Prevotella sp.]|nr:DUF4230 domain-containing protein [Prevotella sp.]